MYRFLTDDKSTASTAEEGLIDERVALFFIEGSEPEYFQKLNGKTQSSFQPFWDSSAPVNDHKHGEYLPFVVSVKELWETVEKQLLPGTKFPSMR